MDLLDDMHLIGRGESVVIKIFMMYDITIFLPLVVADSVTLAVAHFTTPKLINNLSYSTLVVADSATLALAHFTTSKLIKSDKFFLLFTFGLPR
jgi:hypothetical protein